MNGSIKHISIFSLLLWRQMSHSLPVAYSIDRGGLKLDIALVETSRLLLHEETIPEMLEALAQEIEEDGVLKAPVIVDGETMVVLDGMHRVEALRVLGCRFAPICLVDYQNPEIRVESWCRTISKPFNAKEAAKIAGELGLKLSPRQLGNISNASGAFTLLRFKDAKYEVAAPVPGLMPAFDAVRELELRLRTSGFEVGYETEGDAEEKLVRGDVGAILSPPQIGKRQVIEIATRGRVFAFKATRHIVPARPVGVDVPLSLLRDSRVSVERANERLTVLLQWRMLRHEPPGGLWNGRRYDEDLYVFE